MDSERWQTKGDAAKRFDTGTKDWLASVAKPLSSFKWLIENGKVCALNFPIAMSAGLATVIGIMMKLDFERAVLNRVPDMEGHPDRHFREVLFMCDEYQHLAIRAPRDPASESGLT